MSNGNSITDGRVAPTVVRPVVNAITLLRHLGRNGGQATVTQLARMAEINTSTCFNILRTLVAEGVLVFDEDAKTYQIGIGAIELAQYALNDNGKAEVLRPMVEAVSRRYGITLTLWRCWDTHRHLMVGAAESETPYRINMQVGYSSPLFVGALGRCLVHDRGLSAEEIEALYESLTWAQPPGVAAFKAQVAEGAARGWCADDGEFATGVFNVGVLVPRDDAPARYGLVATMFQGQLNPAQVEALAQDMVALAKDMSVID